MPKPYAPQAEEDVKKARMRVARDRERAQGSNDTLSVSVGNLTRSEPCA